MLTQIIQHKREEIDRRKRLYPLDLLRESINYHAPCLSLASYLLRDDKVGIIAEFKRQSPSQGRLDNGQSVEDISIGYMQAGASALSILTDKKFFNGSHEDLKVARKFNYCPILCKDFVLDRYQVHEARASGADVVLLIAAALDPNELSELVAEAHELGMETITEIHSAEELEGIDLATDIIGVNNRDLKTMQTSLQTSIDIARQLPHDLIRISESGMHTAEDVLLLKEHGYQGFLIGTHFMRSGDPKRACYSLVQSLQNTMVPKSTDA